MMSSTYDLAKLGPSAFEHMVNFLVMQTLGLGSTGFGPGADGGRDGYFEGEAPYPSAAQRWKGVWYIQSKFRFPSLGGNPQKWLIDQVQSELEAFKSPQNGRRLPDNWIVATNIDLSGKSRSGSFDKINRIVRQGVGRRMRVHVWGGTKIIQLLLQNPDVAKAYGHFLTPGHVVSALYDWVKDQRAEPRDILRYFIVSQLTDHMFTKLDQAGSSSDVRPTVHELFVDLPFASTGGVKHDYLLADLCSASSQVHKYSIRSKMPDAWRGWSRYVRRSRACLIKGGPGQGKSTVAQYLCQINRAFHILSDADSLKVHDSVIAVATNIRSAAQKDGFWPTSARVPIQIELKEFAHWFAQRKESEATNVLAFLADSISKKINSQVLPKTLKNLMERGTWMAIFDGLDEVPNDYKTAVSKEIMEFLNDDVVAIDADVFAVCTSRPQGYSDQFAGIDGPVAELVHLDEQRAMQCAEPVLKFGRTKEESDKSIQTLTLAMQSPNVQELMTTPLQSHIMAVVVRDGGRPPERRWQLFNSFYLVMKKRESLKNFPNPRIARLLSEEDRLLKSVHTRLGFVLHAKAERSVGAQTALTRDEFRELVRDVVTQVVNHEVDETVEGVMEATIERLVLVSTPESGERVRFDIRQLQEFFAAEFLYGGVGPTELADRIQTIGGDAHWREVIHFVLSALIENQRTAELAIAVQTLRRLNEGDEADPNRLFYRRMARAGWLATRLLGEGVLELDQRDRQQIRPLLDPLGGVPDLETLRPLSRLTLPRSKQWLIQLLLEKITTSNEEEYLGALMLLGWLLPDTSSEAGLVIDCFRRVSREAQERLLSIWTNPIESAMFQLRSLSEVTLSRWLTDVAVTALDSQEWLCLGPSILRSFIYICRSDLEKFAEVCRSNGVDVESTEALVACFKLYEASRQGDDDAGLEVDFGPISGFKFRANWENGETPEQLRGVQLLKSMDVRKGFFHLLMACAWLGVVKSSEALRQVAGLEDTVDCELFGLLPHRLLALIPIADEYAARPYNLDAIKSMDIDRDGGFVNSALKNGADSACALLHLKQREEKGSVAEWGLFAGRFPRLVPDFVFGFGRGNSSEVEITPEIADVLVNMPESTARYILSWGLLSSHADLLMLVKRRARTVVLEDSLFTRFNLRQQILPFLFQMPEDLPLLGILAPALLSAYVGGARSDWDHFRNSANKRPIDEVMELYGFDIDSLKEIAENHMHSRDVRAGAATIGWIFLSEAMEEAKSQQVVPFDVTAELRRFRSLATKDNISWLSRAFIRGLVVKLSESNSDAVSCVTALLEMWRDGAVAVEELSYLLQVWRERSAAPVFATGSLEGWLGYEFQAPQYARI